MNQEGQLWKIGLFLGYNALALYSMNRYVRHFVISRRKSTKTKLSKTQIKKRFGFDKVLKKGSVYGLMMGGLYISGLLLIGYYVLPLSTFRKYCELQAAEYSYSIIHNP